MWWMKSSAAALAMLALVTGSAVAADDAARGKQATRGTNATAQTDAQLATCLAIGNEGEIAIAKFGKQKSENKDVQEFAQMMIDDHTKFLGKLAKFGAATAPRPTTVNAAEGTAHLGLNFMAIERELAKQCQASTEKELGQKEAAEFDKCFLTQQMMAHVHMWDKLTVFKRHASPEFAEVLDEGLKTTEQHLDHAKKLFQQFDDSPRTARR